MDVSTIKNDFTRNELHNLCEGSNFSWDWARPRGRDGGVLVGIKNDNFDILSVEIGVYFVKPLLFNKKVNLSGSSSLCMGMLRM